VNLLLVEPAEIAADGTCELTGRRAEHLRRVLGVEIGSQVKTGVVGGPIGSAVVITDDGERIALRVTATAPPDPQLDVELLLAIPRPKAIARAIETCATFAIRRVDLTNAWRVDKSYLRSPRLAPDVLAHAARLGAEQGATTHLPELAVHDRLMALLDSRFAAPTGALRLVAHPGAPPIETAVSGHAPLTLAIGPEGGWIERELETLVARGFKPVSLGAPILRVEAAIAAALAQITLLRRQSPGNKA